MKFVFLFAGLALLTLRILFHYQARIRLRYAQAVKAKVISSRYTEFGGWWIEAEYSWRDRVHTGHVLSGRRKYQCGDKLDCLLLQGGRLIRMEDASKLVRGKELLLPAIFLLSASAFLFFIPDIDMWKFFVLSALCLSCLVILRWGFVNSIVEVLRGDKKVVQISDVKVLKGMKYFFEYEYNDRTGYPVVVIGSPNLIRQVSLEYLKSRVGSKARVRIDRRTGAVYESSTLGMVLSLVAALMCFLAIVFLA